MNVATVTTGVVRGINPHLVTVEASITAGVPGMTIVGAPDGTARETRDRVRAALLSAGFRWPAKKITLWTVPSVAIDAGMDAAVAVAVLIADGQLDPLAAQGRAFFAELRLDGQLAPTVGVAQLADMARIEGNSHPIVAIDNLDEATAFGEATAVRSLGELAGIEPGEGAMAARPSIADIAAAGHHHTLVIGGGHYDAEGLAVRVQRLLPAPGIEATFARSAAGLRGGEVTEPPLVAPHPTTTAVRMMGGGGPRIMPGAVTLAHQGVLFLDQIEEFAPAVLDALGRAVRDRHVKIARARNAVQMPADALIVARATECPDGSSDQQQRRWERRLQGPLHPMFDIRVSADDVSTISVSSRIATRRAMEARGMQAERGVANRDINADNVHDLVPLDDAGTRMIRDALEAGIITGRGTVAVRRLARTIADFDFEERVLEQHLIEAFKLHGVPVRAQAGE